MTRDEMAKEYAETTQEHLNSKFPNIVPAWGPLAGAFQAGWDAALLHDERVKALLDALDWIEASNYNYGYAAIQVGDIQKRAREALKKWRGDE